MIDNLLGNGDDDDESTASDDDGGLFDEAGGGDLDADADLMGDDDLMEDDADLMGDDDGSLDAMGDAGGGGGGSTGEVQHRVDELENEVESISSDISTVKNENEQISESIDDVEDNIRKLLEIYEMVTKGVNPFVDETEIGEAFSGAGGAGDNSMGLFDEPDDDDESAEDGIDESVANADAEEFFDEDLADEDADVDFDDAEFDDADLAIDDEDERGEFEEDVADSSADEESTAGETAGDGKSFEDLKAEYESESDADGTDDDGADPNDADAEDEVGPRLDDPSHGRTSGVDDGKPYLDAIPAGYLADVVVMDWLEYLVDEAGVDGAARTLAYYEAIEWLSPGAAEQLQTYLLGFGDGVASDPEPRSSLTVAHHNQSLRFISRIADPSMEMVAFDDRSDAARGGGFAGRTTDPTPHSRGAGAAAGPGRRAELESDGGLDHPNDRGVRPADAAASNHRYGRERYPEASVGTDRTRPETDDQTHGETDDQTHDGTDDQAADDDHQ